MTTKEFTPGLLLEIYIDDTIYFGKIEFVYIRYTVFRRLDMTRVIIPNRLLIRVPVMTFGEEENVRLQTSWRLHRDTDLSLSIPLMKQTINALETITEKEFTVITLD